MRMSLLLAGVLTLVAAGVALGAPYYPFNAADFVVPADELDAATIGEAAVHAGFRPIAESDSRFRALKSNTDQTYGVWELPSHKIATIVLTRKMAGVLERDAKRVHQWPVQVPLPQSAMHALAENPL